MRTNSSAGVQCDKMAIEVTETRSNGYVANVSRMLSRQKRLQIGLHSANPKPSSDPGASARHVAAKRPFSGSFRSKAPPGQMS